MATFDIDGDLVRKLAGLLDETGLTEIEFAEGEKRIRVTKGGTAPAFSTGIAGASGRSRRYSAPGTVTGWPSSTIFVSPALDARAAAAFRIQARSWVLVASASASSAAASASVRMSRP